MFGQNKPPHYTDPKYDEKLRKYNAQRESSTASNGGNNGVSPGIFISLGVIVFLAFIMITIIFQNNSGSPSRAFSNENIKTKEDYSFEIIADKEIDTDTYDNVLVETEYTPFPAYEGSLSALKDSNLFEESPPYSDALTDIKTLSDSGKSEVVGIDNTLFTYSDKIHPIFSNATVTMTFRSITDKDDYETVRFLVENSNQPSSEIGQSQLKEIDQELAGISAEKEALEEARRVVREAEYEKEQAEQEQADQEKEDNRYVKVSEENGVHRWEVLIEADQSLSVWGTNGGLVAVKIYDEFGSRMDYDYTTAPDFDFYLSTKSSNDHVVQLEIEYSETIDYNLRVE